MKNNNDTDIDPAKVLYLEGIEVPQGKEEINAFIQSRSLKHGDVINFGDYRFIDAKIVQFNEDVRKYELLDNIDATDAGYLEIPLEITRHIKSALRKYHNIIEEIGHINLVLSPQDEFIQLAFDILGDAEKILLIIDDGYIGMAIIYQDISSESGNIVTDLTKINEIAKDNNLL